MASPWLTAGVAYVWTSAVADLPIPDFPQLDLAGGVFSDMDWQAGEGGVWGLGTLLLSALVAGWAFRLVCGLRAQYRLQDLKAKASPCTDTALVRMAEKFADRLALRTAPRLQMTSNVSTPFAAGIRNRAIYLPTSLIGSGHEQSIIAHGSVHIASNDQITRLFERLVADILWFSPFAWIVRKRLDYLREAVCDIEAIALTGSRREYAKALVVVARGQGAMRALPVASFISKDRQALKRRITSLMNTDQSRPARSGAIVAVGLLLAVPMAMAQGLWLSADGFVARYTHVVIATPKAKISSKWGNRKDPKKDVLLFHKGVDVSAPKGTPIYAPADGTITYCGPKRDYGNIVDVLLDDGTKLRFAQLKKAKVKSGQRVNAGDVIGLVGQSVSATAPHLHLEVWRNDSSRKAISRDPEAEGIRPIN